MADVPQQLTFLAWVRPDVTRLITGQQGGRASAAAEITLTESGGNGAAGRTETRTLPFLLAGPADVLGLQPGAVVRRYPAAGVLDHESDRCPYVELADPGLPWRYTPAVTPAGANLHPWLVLVVGGPDELTFAGSEVSIAVTAQEAHPIGGPAQPYRFAHVQQDAAGHRVTRILSGRPLSAGTDYVAVLVPAFDSSGTPAWTGAAPVTLPVHDRWQFRTALPAGSFEDLAARLTPGQAPVTTGHAPLTYPRLDPPAQMEVLGALVARTPSGSLPEDPPPPDVAADLDRLRSLPAKDERGRPVVTLPRYGDAWPAAADAAWGEDLNADPRHRGVAGVGLDLVVRRQEDLVGDVLDHLGALQESRQRIRKLAMGIEAARRLWARRTPSDAQERLWLLGPALDRLVTADGPIGELATAAGRTVARGTFSAAARRVVRVGPARTAGSAHAAGGLLASANRQPPAVPSVTAGLPLDDTGLKALDAGRRKTVQLGRVDATRLAAAAAELAARTGTQTRSAATTLVTRARQAADAGSAVPWGSVLATLAACDPQQLARRSVPGQATDDALKGLGSLSSRITGPAGHGGADDLLPLLKVLNPEQPGDPVLAPLALDSLAAGVSAAFDPSGASAPAIVRVLTTISGGSDGGIAPDRPLAPPEPCPGLDRPAWADLAADHPEWLLPGATDLGSDCVVALESNPVFIDAYLAGLNTQLLGELRWRNLPVATGCTPLRRFWDRADTATGERRDDIVGIASWPSTGPLGDASHRAPGASGRDLVIAVRGDLFVRYPATLVYLRSAVHAPQTVPDFAHDPPDDAARHYPGFRGRVSEDIVFFGFPDVDVSDLPQYWLVLEEPPAGYRFRNDVAATAQEGHTWAAEMLAAPVRVLIRGDHLDAGGHA